MVAKHHQKVAAKKEGMKKTMSAKQPKSKPAAKKSSKPAPAPKPKSTKERPSKASTARLPKPKPAKEKRTPAMEASSTGPYALAQDDTSAIIIRDSPSPADAETVTASEKTDSGGKTEILQIDEEQGKDVDDQVNLDEKTDELDQRQARSDPSRTPEPRSLPEQEVMDEDQAGPDPGESHEAFVGPDPEPTHEEFMADLYPKVQEILKFLADEHVFLEEPISSTGTLSSMKNLEDAYTIGDQFINDISIEDDPEKPMWKHKWSPWLPFQFIKHLPQFLHCPHQF
nr:hypothetical protein [Tanacetum cinerariifolium]